MLNSQAIDDISSQSIENDSEIDNSSTNSDLSLDEKQKTDEEITAKTSQQKPKPLLPVKPNILMPKPRPILKSNSDNKKKLTEVKISDSVLYVESIVSYDENSLPQIVSDHIYQEIYDSIGNTIMNENNNNIVCEKINEITANEKRELKLAELAQELELVRHSKRPAPQPPKKVEEEAEDEDKNKPSLSYTNKVSVNDKQSSQHSSTKTKFSIKKLLHKKSSTSDKNKESTDSQTSTFFESSTYQTTTTSNPKAWKQSEFDRTNLKIIHPIDLVVTNAQESSETIKECEAKPEVQTRPEAPPRTPKPVRPSVPTRKKAKSISSPTKEPPPPPQRLQSIPVVDMTIKNTLTEAYNQLAKSNHNNLASIKTKIESLYNSHYKWSDFEIGSGIKYGSAMVYKDAIVSNTQKSVNLVVSFLIN